MKDYETFQPLKVQQAQGSYLYLQDGTKIIDAISSWWCKSLGHNHPAVAKALIEQVNRFEHVILANTTNETIAKLSEKLTALAPHLKHVMYASDGSCAVEIALKMSLHSRKIKSEFARTKFISLANGYHGETAGALSVSDVGIFKSAYQDIMFDCHYIENIPYVSGINDPLWNDCSEVWEQIEKSLTPFAETATAIIIEPILQGAGGMCLYSQDFLKRLAKWARKNHIHLIADEIMTGFGRLGKTFAYEYADIQPDFVCIAKGLTAGWLPMSAMLTTQDMYETFYDDYQKCHNFLHSHTHTGNALAAAVAINVLEIIEQENLYQRALGIGEYMLDKMHEISHATGKLKNIRGIGAVVAADLIVDDASKRYGYQVYQKAVELGALLRPLGNTIYWLPPLNIEFEIIDSLATITQQALCSVMPA